jgi:hypothetical protein
MKFYRDTETKTEFIKCQDDSINSGLGKYVGIRTNEMVTLRNDLMEEISFHEAFRNDVNKIVLDAVTSQNRESLYDHTGRNSLAVSDMQKKWILDHYVLKHEASENLEKENLLLKERIMELTQKNIDMQTKYTQKIKDVDLLFFHYENQKKFIQHLQDYIASKHLESEGLILEKFIEGESKNV